MTIPGVGVWGVMRFTSSCFLTLRMLHTKLDKVWSSSSLEDVNGHQTKAKGQIQNIKKNPQNDFICNFFYIKNENSLKSRSVCINS